MEHKRIHRHRSKRTSPARFYPCKSSAVCLTHCDSDSTHERLPTTALRVPIIALRVPIIALRVPQIQLRVPLTAFSVTARTRCDRCRALSRLVAVRTCMRACGSESRQRLSVRDADGDGDLDQCSRLLRHALPLLREELVRRPHDPLLDDEVPARAGTRVCGAQTHKHTSSGYHRPTTEPVTTGSCPRPWGQIRSGADRA
jgi:hypothetical protein